MKVYNLPDRRRCLLFDIDNTLYRNDEYCELQVTLLIRRFANEIGVAMDKAEQLVREKKDEYAARHNGGKTSTGNIMVDLGVPLATNAEWRNQLFYPEDFLSPDVGTINAIAHLSNEYALGAVTNNTVELGRRTLAALNINRFFPVLIGLDTCFVSKPAKEPYLEALRQLEVTPERSVSIGDRYDVDIAVPLKMGMGGILVETLEDMSRVAGVLSQST